MAVTATILSPASRQGQIERADTLVQRNALLTPGDTITVRIKRSAGAGAEGREQEFAVPYQKWMRVLDALNWIAENDATDLAYRWFCGSKMCGTCAVRMNGREVLACWEAVEPQMTIEPLRNLPVVRDLVVDRSPYENKVASLEPWLRRPGDYAGFPEPLSHKQMKNASKALDCISCMCCYSACPVIRLGDLTDFAGPAPLVQLGQTALDPRNDPQRIARRWRGPASSTACPATNARRCARPASRSSARSSSRSRRRPRLSSQRWHITHSPCARSSPRAAASTQARSSCACRAGARCCASAHSSACWCAARSTRSGHVLAIKTAAAAAARRILGRRPS